MDQQDMFALAKQMDKVLCLEESPPSYDNGEMVTESGSTHEEIEPCYIRLLQFTVFLENSFQSTSRQEANHWHDPHVLLHLADIDAVPKSVSNLEPVEISLISDKFPEDEMGLKNLYKMSSCKDAFFLVKFWADFNFGDVNGRRNNHVSTPTYHVSSRFESFKNIKLSCTTRVCSFGNSIGEKQEEFSGMQIELNRYLHENVRSPLCDYLVNFIEKLKTLDVATMNGVLENFTVLQVIANQETKEILMVLAFLFEVCPSESETGAACNIYRIV